MAEGWRDELKFAYLIEPPFCYRTADGRVTGCDVEVAHHVLEFIGAGPFVPVETEFAELIPGLVDGRWTMTTGLFASDERRKAVDFSRPVWVLGDGLLVRAGNPNGIQGYRSLAADASLRLAVISDQVQHFTALSHEVPDARIKRFDTYEDAAGAVLSGTVDAYASVARAHRGYLEQHPDLPLAVADVPSEEKPPEYGAFAFAKADASLREAVDGVLKTYLGSPEHRLRMREFGFADADIDLIVS